MKRYPLESLASFLGVKVESLARELGVSGSTWKEYRDKGVSEKVADRLASKAGVPAYTVWPEMLDDSIAACGQPCERCEELFQPTNKRQRFCSANCRGLAWKQHKYRTDPEFREKARAHAAAYYEEAGEYARARQRRYYQANLERERAARRAYRARKKAQSTDDGDGNVAA